MMIFRNLPASRAPSRAVTSRGTSSAALVLATILTLAAGPAAAQQPPNPTTPPAPSAGTTPAKPADPKALFASGEKKFKAGDFAGALVDFEASNAAKEDPATLRYLGQTQDNLGHAAEAVAAYEKFLANVPASMKAQADEVKHRVDAIRVTPGHVHVESAPPGAIVIIDGQPSSSNTPADFDLPPGHHTLRISSAGYDYADRDIDVAFATKADVRVDLVKTPEPPPPPPVDTSTAPPTPPPPPPPEPRSKLPAYVTGAIAIVAAGVGTGFGIKALSQSNKFKNTPTTELADDGENNALVADMMFGVAITFGVTSAVLFLSGDTATQAKNNKSAPAPAAQANATKRSVVTITPTPFVTSSGGGAGALVSF